MSPPTPFVFAFKYIRSSIYQRIDKFKANASPSKTFVLKKTVESKYTWLIFIRGSVCPQNTIERKMKRKKTKRSELGIRQYDEP